MVKEATTPAPEKKEETTASKEPEAITSEKPKEASAASSEVKDPKVVELEGKVKTLETQLGQLTTLQSQADRKRKIAERESNKLAIKLKKIQKGEVDIDDEIPSEDSLEESQQKDAIIRIQGLILRNPDYQEVIKKDSTLRDVIAKNPLALLEEFFSIEDAAEQIKELLDAKVSSLSAQPAQPEEEKGKETGAEVESGVVQPAEGSEESTSKEAKTVVPMDNVEKSISEKINIT